MLSLLAQATGPVRVETILSLFSAAVTSYFWFVKARQERPSLKFFQLQDFRASLRRGDPEKKTKRLGLMQIESSGVLVANNSIRQNSIVRFECRFDHDGRTYRGSWGYVEDDKPPWNLAPQSTIALRLACFFDVPEDFEVPENMKFHVDFFTASGQRFGHLFSLNAPQT